MSYQIAFVIKADKSIAQIFNPVTGGRTENQTTQIGWWIPSRGQDIPAEEYTMQLLDVNLYPTLWTSTIRSLTTKYKSGLYDKPLAILNLPINTEAVKEEEENPPLEEIWRFNEDGVMDSATPTDFSKLTQEDFFVPIMSKTKISRDMLVIALEGTALKKHLPEVRWGTTVPFTF